MILMNTEGRTAMPDDRHLPDLDYDREKVDETVLALLSLTLHDYHRAWKGHDWDVLAGCTSAVTLMIQRTRQSRCC
jgi:hypothetical protein